MGASQLLMELETPDAERFVAVTDMAEVLRTSTTTLHKLRQVFEKGVSDE